MTGNETVDLLLDVVCFQAEHYKKGKLWQTMKHFRDKNLAAACGTRQLFIKVKVMKPEGKRTSWFAFWEGCRVS